MSDENNFKPTLEGYKPLRPFNLFMKNNFPFIENTFEALDTYVLLCKIVEYLNTVIDNTNTMEHNITALDNAFNELNDYVSHYFDNLDVQEEINNKLDDMVEAGTLQEIITTYLNTQALFMYDTVEDMTEATNLINGSYAKTLGFHAKNDGGASYYLIRTITNDDVIDNITIIPMENDNTLIAELLINKEMKVECFGAYGDDTNDDYDSFVLALTKCTSVLLSNKTYLLSTQLRIDSDKQLKGINDCLGYAKLDAPYGVKLAGARISFQNIELIGAEQANYGIYGCGDNEGGGTEGANHYKQNIIKNVIITEYNYGIYFNGVVWNNTFENIRINKCNYGLSNSSTYYIMTAIFSNVYFSGCKTYNVYLYKTWATFNSCNFGISTTSSVYFSQDCNIQINSSSFECDKYIEGTGFIVTLTGKTMTINNTNFTMCCDNTITLFQTSSGVESLTLNDIHYTSTSIGGQSNNFQKVFSDGIRGTKCGAITIGNGCESLPVNIENAYRISYAQYKYVRWHGLIQTYDTISDLSLLTKGDMVYFYQTNKIKYYNGTDLVEI